MIGALHAPTKTRGHIQHQGKRGEGEQGQAPVEATHDEDNAPEHERIIDDIEDTRGDELAQGVDIIRQARHDAACFRLIEKTEG